MAVAICGIGMISSVGRSAEEILHSIKNGRRGVGRLTLFDSVLDVPVAQVPFGNSELQELLGLDRDKVISRTALLGMLAASDAVFDAKIPEGVRVGLISATSVGGMDMTEQFYGAFMDDPLKGDLHYVAGHDCAYSTLAIAAYCGIKQFSTTLSTACSSAANAIMLGARMLQQGMLDYVVAGGTDALSRFTLNGFNSLMILDRQPCRPFDRDRAGLTLGEGAGYVVMTCRDPAKKYCLLTGYGNANDAFHQTASSADGNGAYLSMRKALETAELRAKQINYVNIHGTGTSNNDASEGVAMKRIFGSKVPPFSSTKPFTGHTLAAAGGIEAVLSVLAIDQGVIYPNLGFANPIEESGLVPQTVFAEGVDVRHVMSNSFGFGGNNSTLIFSK